MLQFKVVKGKHYEGTKCYKKGDIIASDKPLDKLFRNKFEIVSRPVEVDTVGSSPSSGPESDPVETLVMTPVLEEVETEDTITSTSEEEQDVYHGDDVTKKFPDAIAKGVLVYRKGRKYTVVDFDSNEVLDSTMTRKAKVEEWLKEW